MLTLPRQFFVLLAMSVLPAAVAGDEPQPRVLVIGDSIYQSMSRSVSMQLADRVEIVFATVPRGEVHNSATVLKHLDSIIGDGDWDLIHFNCGLGDLVYRARGVASFRVMPIHSGGVRATSAEEYEANLRKLVRRLKQTEARLVWANTTPIRHSSTNVFQLKSEVEYNAIAKRVMADEGVRINDMYSFVLGQIDMDRPASHGADPFFFDRKPIHHQVANAVLGELGLSIDPVDSSDE